MLNRLNKEMIAALKSGDKFRKTTLSTLIAAVKRAAIDSGCRDNITDEMVIQVLKKEKKSLVDAVEKFPDMPAEKKSEYICMSCYVSSARGIVINKGALALIPIKLVHLTSYILGSFLTVLCHFCIVKKGGAA